MSDKETNIKFKRNYLGASSLMLAIFAISGCWIPFFNILSVSAAIAGFLFGAWSLAIIWFTQKKYSKKMILSLCGVLMSLLAMVTALSTNHAVFSSHGGIKNFVVEVMDAMVGKNIGDGSEQTSNSEKRSKGDVNTSKKSQIQTSRVYRIGETAELNDRKVTIADVQNNFSMNNEYSVPREGFRFVKVSVRVENTSDSDILLSPQELKIQDDSGSTGSIAAVTYLLDDQFESVTLSSNEVKEGDVIFEVSGNYENFKFVYQPSSSESKVEFEMR